MTESTTVPAKRSSPIGAFVIGGAILASGFGAAWYLQDAKISRVESQLDALRGDLTAQLAQQIAQIPTPDLTPMTAGLETAQDQIADLNTALGSQADQISVLAGRLDATELLASGGAADASEAGSYVARVEARLRELETNAASITVASDELRAEAQAAEAAARLAEGRAALAHVQTALGNGAPFADALVVLGRQTDIPADLSAAAEGVATLDALRDELPPLARAAISAARDSGESNENLGGVSGFLSKQFDLRSTTVREGDSTDAILSRVEAATRADDLATALSEADALPETAKTELADWLARAQIRHSAQTAASAVADALK